MLCEKLAVVIHPNNDRMFVSDDKKHATFFISKNIIGNHVAKALQDLDTFSLFYFPYKNDNYYYYRKK
jgi:hypothetical protein